MLQLAEKCHWSQTITNVDPPSLEEVGRGGARNSTVQFGGGLLKALTIIHNTMPGGVQRLGAYEAVLLKRLNYESYLLSIVKSKTGEWNLFKKLKIKPIYLARNEILGRTLYTLMLDKMPINIGSKLSVIIAHNIPGGQIALGLSKRHKRRILTVIYLHDPLVYPISGSFYTMISTSFPHILLRLEEKLVRELDIVLVNSRRTLFKLLKIHNKIKSILLDKVHVLYPTVNIPIPEKYIKKEKRNYLLIVGRIDHEAFFNLYKILKKIDIPIIIAGSYHPYNTNSRNIIKIFYNLKKNGKKIKFIFNPSDSELFELYRNALLFVYPGHENFNMSALEAMSAGCPVLVASSSGVCELLPETLKEYICLPKDRIDIWVTRILEIVRNDESYYLGKKLWRITKKYNIYTHMNKLAKILKN